MIKKQCITLAVIICAFGSSLLVHGATDGTQADYKLECETLRAELSRTMAVLEEWLEKKSGSASSEEADEVPVAVIEAVGLKDPRPMTTKLAEYRGANNGAEAIQAERLRIIKDNWKVMYQDMAHVLTRLEEDDVICQTVTHQEYPQKLEMLVAMSKAPHKAMVPLLYKIARNEQEPRLIRRTAVGVLGMIPQKKAVSVLISILEEEAEGSEVSNIARTVLDEDARLGSRLERETGSEVGKRSASDYRQWWNNNKAEYVHPRTSGDGWGWSR
jgi:uncharacterized protein (UPF0147 family)